jgi:hypothetical protein
MRIIGNIEHPLLKITIFKMDNRVSVKFENTLYEQTFKLGDDERIAQPEAIRQLVDAQFIDQVQTTFRQMHQTKLSGYARLFPVEEQAHFETII